jgi:hypothetical protein
MTTVAITANYVPSGDDWSVRVTGGHRTLNALAPGLIAARDQADQFVERLSAGYADRAVVHLLQGDAYAFTVAYLQARHGVRISLDAI